MPEMTLAERQKEYYNKSATNERMTAYQSKDQVAARQAKQANLLGVFTVPTFNSLPYDKTNDPYVKFTAPDDRHCDTRIKAKGEAQDRFKRVSVPKKGKSNYHGSTLFEGKHVWLQKNLEKNPKWGEYPANYQACEKFVEAEKSEGRQPLIPEDPVGKGKSNYFDKLSVANLGDKSLHYGGRGNALMGPPRQVKRSINGTEQIGFGSTDPPRTDEFCFDANSQRWCAYLKKEEGYQRGFRAGRQTNFSELPQFETTKPDRLAPTGGGHFTWNCDETFRLNNTGPMDTYTQHRNLSAPGSPEKRLGSHAAFCSSFVIGNSERNPETSASRQHETSPFARRPIVEASFYRTTNSSASIKDLVTN